MNYTPYHLHTDKSNPTTVMDCVDSYNVYVNKAKEFNMPYLGFSEHGNVFGWIKKKLACDNVGIKYIHGIEIYVTKENERIRDNYHVVLIAKNKSGVEELNILSSKSFNRADVKVIDNNERFYFNPRITFKELKSISNNIFVTTACLGGILNSGDEKFELEFLEFMSNNKERCFLEIQHHNVEEQKEYNKKLYELSQKYDIKLIAGTDTHAIDSSSSDSRRILQAAKRTRFDNEDGWDLVFKSYDELVTAYKIQNSLPEVVYMEAINNTNIIGESVEDFSFDRTNKYPKLYPNTEDVFKRKIEDGLIWRNINKNNKKYSDRIEYEYNTMKIQGALDYILLEEKIKSWARDNNIYYGYSRGSSSGSIIAYLLGVTDVDSIKYDLDFERFMNSERVSLCDIDTDWPPDKREDVKDYIYSIPELETSEIITFNTIALKGAIRDVCRAFNMELDLVNKICNSIEYDENKWRSKYPEIFSYVDKLIGTIVSIGVHPAATIVCDSSLQSMLGTCTLPTSKFPVSQCDMKEVDYLNLVKLDVLGLDNIKIINETCEMAGIERLTPDNMDFSDENVWNSILESQVGIFQFTQDYAHSYLNRLMSKETIWIMESDGGRVDPLYLATIATGAIRPAGESYRETLASGMFNRRGHKALDEFLSKTRGELVFQEDIIKFLNKFSGFTMGEADVVRRGFAKKTGTEQYIPRIRDGFIKTMRDKYNTSEEDSERLIVGFIKVIEDASDYLFSLLHALPYTMISFACGYLRHYHKLEFLTVMLNTVNGNLEKTAEIIQYANSCGIQVKSPKFGYSRNEYFFDRSSNSIYRGISSAKYITEQCGIEFQNMENNKFNSFLDLLVYMSENTKINSRQIDSLIKIGFFEEFGKDKKLFMFWEEFSKGKSRYSPKHKDATKEKRIGELKEKWEEIENKDFSIKQRVENEIEILGQIQSTFKHLKNTGYVLDIDLRFAPKIRFYSFNKGTIGKVGIYKNVWNKVSEIDGIEYNGNLEIGDIIKWYPDKYLEKKKAQRYIDGDYVGIEGQYTYWMHRYRKLN